ncbi:MAG: hypothetical protein NMNS02_07310 [Nitrosomonas sp.]|nr:MAG: hypothetical protein NMNS02_07310 [Nitrosomonas sp.]
MSDSSFPNYIKHNEKAGVFVILNKRLVLILEDRLIIHVAYGDADTLVQHDAHGRSIERRTIDELP